MTKRLYRSRKDQMIAGVCGGIGEYLNIDPTLVRLAFLLLAIWGGGGVLAYLIAWIVIPEEPVDDIVPSPKAQTTVIEESNATTVTEENNTPE
ncbi:MAG: PspC domain-containing protein [Chloroflexi bacterium]|nr:PspC domain-containing protein [Chloroflexota bacterium]